MDSKVQHKSSSIIFFNTMLYYTVIIVDLPWLYWSNSGSN